jgi:hypothetical protein
MWSKQKMRFPFPSLKQLSLFAIANNKDNLQWQGVRLNLDKLPNELKSALDEKETRIALRKIG